MEEVSLIRQFKGRSFECTNGTLFASFVFSRASGEVTVRTNDKVLFDSRPYVFIFCSTNWRCDEILRSKTWAKKQRQKAQNLKAVVETPSCKQVLRPDSNSSPPPAIQAQQKNFNKSQTGRRPPWNKTGLCVECSRRDAETNWWSKNKFCQSQLKSVWWYFDAPESHSNDSRTALNLTWFWSWACTTKGFWIWSAAGCENDGCHHIYTLCSKFFPVNWHLCFAPV